ncbi:unnamed protein product [Urochloa humidicola]
MAKSFSDSWNHQPSEVSDHPAACPLNRKIGRGLLLRSAGQVCRDAGVPALVVLLFLTYSLATTVHRVGDRPWDLAFVAFAYADLAGLCFCLRRAERLPREPSPAAEGKERSRLQLAVCALTASLSCVFAFRLSLIMSSAALVIVIWSMTAFVVLAGFFVLLVCKDQGYRCALAGNGDGDAGNGKSFKKRIAGSGGAESV